MHRFFVSIIFISIGMSLLTCTSSENIGVKPSASQLGLFETLFINISIPQSFSNPHDPDDISVDVIIYTLTGDTLSLPCFYKSGRSGHSTWEARYTPMQTGENILI
ncbi:DUF5060 domain-containing protein [candidate division KSB1 bacterium]|nr:DUF5060 domain-containing protein [candidate division KSB1 bacterium]